MTKLMVSVRDSSEAQIALSAGVDLIDVKEPRNGPLGMPDSTSLQEVINATDGALPVSVALGELVQHSQAASVPDGVNFAKVGLSACSEIRDWPSRLLSFTENLPSTTRPVAVTYADWRSASAPCPMSILEFAVASGFTALLVDTFDKSHGDLFACWHFSLLEEFVHRALEAKLEVALAGSLDEYGVRKAVSLAPHYVAVRSAACRGGRGGQLDADRVHLIRNIIGSGCATPLAASDARTTKSRQAGEPSL